MTFHPESAARLLELYRVLRRHFGYAHPWWPGTPFQIAVTALLVQQCDWSIAWKAVLQLDAAGIDSLKRLAESEVEQVLPSIRQVTFARTKAGRLVEIARRVTLDGFETCEQFLSPERDTSALRRDLLALPGIGRETADCLLGFASTHPAFVVDAYTRRIFPRLNVILDRPPAFWEKAPYAVLQQFFETHLLTDLSLYDEFAFPAELPREVALLRDYHALLVELGKHHCLKTRPRCQDTGKQGWPDYEFCVKHCLPNQCTACPLAALCEFDLLANVNRR